METDGTSARTAPRYDGLAAALDYAARGIPVFPLKPREKIPVIPKREGGSGLYDATTDEATIRRWWKRWPRANIGMPTGALSGLLVLEIDPRHGGTLDGLTARGGPLPDTLLAQSGGGGWHFFLRHPGGIVRGRKLFKLPDGKPDPAYEVKADGGYVVLAPSIHPSGTPYAWQNQIGAADMPPWLVRLLAENDAPRPRRDGPAVAGADDAAHWLDWAMTRTGAGNGDRTGYDLAVQLLVNGLADPETILLDYADRATMDPGNPFDDRSVQRWMRSAARSRIVAGGEPARKREPLHKPIPIHRPAGGSEYHKSAHTASEPGEPAPTAEPIRTTDLGNARRLVRRHGADMRYVAKWGHWLIWDGTRWRVDETDEAMRRAKDTVASIYAEAADATDDNERRDLAKWAMRSEAQARLVALLALAESEPTIALAPEQLDAAKHLLNCRNGMVNLTTGALVPHDRDALCTKRAEVDYDPAADCPAWLAFLAHTFAGDEELIAFVRRAVGYSLTCETSEQCVIVLHGTGANGKSTFLETVCALLGDYAMTTPTDTLMAKQGQTIPSDVARLNGARFVAASESGDGRRMDEELIKRISGGDRMAARFMHRDWFQFYPVLKLWLAVNHKPTIRGTDNGIWRRIRLVPFGVTLTPAEQDRTLPAKLRAESAGILAWAVRGALEWQRDGLQTPARVLDATTEYRAEMDAVGRFIAECCVEHAGARVASRALYTAYETWCNDNGEHKRSQNQLAIALRDRGLTNAKDRRGSMVWRGIGLLSDPIQGGLS